MWNRDALFRVILPVAEDRRDRLTSTHATVTGIPLAPVGEHCPGAITLRSAPGGPLQPRTPRNVDLLLTNDGDSPWPGVAFVPRHLVRVSATFVSSTTLYKCA